MLGQHFIAYKNRGHGAATNSQSIEIRFTDMYLIDNWWGAGIL